MEKIDRYDWNRPGELGKKMLLDVDQLKIDYRYQRQEVSEENTLSIARNFSWEAFNMLLVVLRKDGHYYVVDGQQRFCAARRRGDINKVPCNVFLSTGLSNEARMFRLANMHRKPVKSFDKWRSALAEGAELERSIKKWLDSVSVTSLDKVVSTLEVTPASNKRHHIDFPALLVKTWKIDPEFSKLSINYQACILEDEEAFNSLIHKGLFYLFKSGRLHMPQIHFADKVSKAGGKKRLLKEIRVMGIEVGISLSERVCGLGIAKVLNIKNKKNKINMEDDKDVSNS